MGVSKQHFRHSKKVTRGRRWTALRMEILERDGFKCCKCGDRGRLEVDHIQPVRTHPDLAYAPSNLQALCPICHTKKTRIECGHAPPDQRRQDWREAVASLERGGKNQSSNRSKPCLNP